MVLNTVVVTSSAKKTQTAQYGKITQPVLPTYDVIGADSFPTYGSSVPSGAYNPYWISAKLSGNQTTNLGVGQPVAIDTIEGGNLTINSNSVVLLANKNYFCQAYINDSINSSGTNGSFYKFYNVTAGTYFDNVITTTQTTSVQLRVYASGISTVFAEGTSVYIQSL